MFYLSALSVQRLRDARVWLDPGLTDEEVTRVQERVGFTFGVEHRELLQEALPVGDFWPDWRDGSTSDLRAQLSRPVEGVLSHVRRGDFWPASWGDRLSQDDRVLVARDHLARVPLLVPVYSHRYLASDAVFVPSPVFSIYGTDIIYFGDDILDYVVREFHVPPRHQSSSRTYVPFWSDLAEGAADENM